MTKKISKKICKLAGIEAKRQIEVNCCNECSDCQSGDCNTLYYPDFESPENLVKLLECLKNTGHTVEISKDSCSISNGDTDFVEDGYDSRFSLWGDTFLEALINYLTKWRKQLTRYGLPDGTMSEWIDTSSKLTKRDCIYPRGIDDLNKSIRKLKQALQQTEWVY